MEQQQDIPDFMKKYHQGSNGEGRAHLDHLAKQYKDERATFLQTTFVAKQQFQRDWNKLTGKNTVLTPEEALRPMQAKYGDKAKQIAREHGYVEQKATQEHAPGQKHQPAGKQQPSDREAFLQKIKSAKEQATQKQQQTATAEKKPKAPQTDREKIIAQLKSMHAENAQMTQRPKP